MLTDPDGGVLLADAAALTPDLDRGADLQRAAARSPASCSSPPPRSGAAAAATPRSTGPSPAPAPSAPRTRRPTWAIRASRVTQDAVERRIYFENARLELFGLPVGYLPRLSIPEPGRRAGQRRAGAALPAVGHLRLRLQAALLPRARPLGRRHDHAVPHHRAAAALIEGEYRRRFANGGFDLWGVVALDDGLDGGDPGRGAFLAAGAFRSAATASSPTSTSTSPATTASCTQFDYSDADQLTSFARVCAHPRRRVRRARHRRLPEPARRRGHRRRPLRPSRVHLPPADRRARRSAAGSASTLNSLGILRDDGSNMVRAGGAGRLAARRGLLPHGVLADDAPPRPLRRRLPGLGQPRHRPTASRPAACPTAAVELRWPLVRAHRPAPST